MLSIGRRRRVTATTMHLALIRTTGTMRTMSSPLSRVPSGLSALPHESRGQLFFYFAQNWKWRPKTGSLARLPGVAKIQTIGKSIEAKPQKKRSLIVPIRSRAPLRSGISLLEAISARLKILREPSLSLVAKKDLCRPAQTGAILQLLLRRNQGKTAAPAQKVGKSFDHLMLSHMCHFSK